MKKNILGKVAFLLSDLEPSHSQDDVTSYAKYQLLRTGTFNDPRYGDLTVTPQMLQEMKRNFDEKVRGIDVAIDFSHDNHKEAAGWVTALYLENNDTELWAEVSWTDKGKFAIANKEYRYLSSEFMTQYQDNESKKVFGTVLLGAGLTNRPVVKRMHPIVELSELKTNQEEGDKSMEEELKKEIEQLKAKVAELEAKLVAAGEEKKQAADAAAAAEQQLSEGKEEVKKLAEEKEKLTEENKKLSEEKAKAEKEKAFEALLSDGKAVPAQKEAFLADDMKEFIAKAGVVNLGEGKGSEGGTKETDLQVKPEEVENKVTELAEKALEEKRAGDMKEAVSLVLSENPKLNEEYEKKTKVSA